MISETEYDQDNEIEEAQEHVEITDIHDLPIFSEEFAEQVDQYHYQRRQEREQAFRNVFIGEQTEDLSAIFEKVVRAEPEMVFQPEHHQPELVNDSPLQLITFITIGMSLACLLIILIQIIKKQKG